MLSKKSYNTVLSPLVKILETHYLGDPTFCPAPDDVQSLATFTKLASNIVENPESPKYRVLKITNPTLAKLVYQHAIGPAVLQELGFVRSVHAFEEKWIFYSLELKNAPSSIEGPLSDHQMKLITTGYEQLSTCLATVQKRVDTFKEKSDYKKRIAAEERQRKAIMDQYAEDRERVRKIANAEKIRRRRESTTESSVICQHGEDA